MIRPNLIWHPKFSFYCFKKIGVMLLSENSFFWLPENLYPAMALIDGKTSIDDITNKLTVSNPTELTKIATFTYQINQLKKQGFLIECNDIVIDQYQIPQLKNLSSLYHNNSIEILSLSSASDFLLCQWCKLLPAALLKEHSPDITKLSILLVDDFLDSRIEKIIQPFNTYCVIKITGDTLAITPVFYQNVSTKKVLPKTNDSNWQQLLGCLYQNKPVRQFLSRLYPDQANFVPFKHENLLSEAQYRILEDLLCRQLNSQSNNLLQYQLNSNTTTEHQTHIDNVAFEDKNTLFNEAIVLQHVQSKFNKDGGSRAISPTETVNKIMPFVDAITGFIPNIELLEPEKTGPIKIYRTAFFKTPLIRDLAKLDDNSFVQTCLGKGVTNEQSQASALCEAIERLNAQFKGDEPLYQASPSELTQRYVNFHALSPYSTTQYRKFSTEENAESQLKQAVIPYNNESIYWLTVWSLTHEEQVYVPLSCCFANIELREQKKVPRLIFDDNKFGCWHSNGAAAGNTLEEAILQALFELIERDATAIWWYNQVERPAFDLTKIESKYYQPLQQSLSKNHHFWVLDLTHDLGVPVMVAIGQHKSNNGFIFGFGCHLQPELAAQRALTELCQLIPIRDQNSAPFNFDAITTGAYLYPNKQQQAEMPFTFSSGDIKTDILALVEQLKSVNLETLVLNYSRAPFPIYTAKVFVPGLCHIWPQFANERLYQVPVQLNWLTKAKNENTINQQGLYI